MNWLAKFPTTWSACSLAATVELIVYLDIVTRWRMIIINFELFVSVVICMPVYEYKVFSRHL